MFLLIAAFTSGCGRSELPYLTYGDEDADRVSSESTININLADLEELASLPGLGEKRALAIISHRSQYGDFGRNEELMLVEGIGEKLYLKLASRIRTE